MSLARVSQVLSLLLPVTFASTLYAQTEGTPLQNLVVGTYQISPNSNAAACVEVRGSQLADGTPVDVSSCISGQPNELWKLVPAQTAAGPGYELISANSGSCLDIADVSQASGAATNQWTCGASQLNQVWQVYPFGSSYELVSLNSGKCLDLPNGNSANGVQLKQFPCAKGNNPNQQWNLRFIGAQGAAASNVGSGPYQLQPTTNPGTCADVTGGFRANSTPIISYQCGASIQPNQSWSLVQMPDLGSSFYEIVSVNSGSCMDVAGVSRVDGASVAEWACLGKNQVNQIWQLYPYGSSFELVSLNSGMCLDLSGRGGGNGNQLRQSTCGAGSRSSQLWGLNATGVVTPPVIAPPPVVVSAPVQPLSTTATLQVVPVTAVTGQNVTFTARVASATGVPGGTVSFYDGAILLGTAVLDASGLGSFTTAGLANGTHPLSASYNTGSVYAGSTSAPIQVTVAQPATGEQAMQADSFVDSVGVQTHIGYTDTTYFSKWPTVLSELQSLGIRHLRDGYSNWTPDLPFFGRHNILAASGIKTTFIVPIDSNPSVPLLQSFASAVQDLEALEAPNECDAVPNCGGGDLAGVNNVVPFLPLVRAAGNALKVPVLGPSFTRAEAYAAAGNISAQMDYNNLHVYFGGRNPGSYGWGGGDAQGNFYGSFAWWLDQANLDAPGVPSIITETGYLSFPTTNIPYTIPESVEATYMSRLLLLAFNRGIRRTFIYELIDETPGTGYGLLRYDTLAEKPALTAIKNMISVLADPGSSFSPGKLDYTISGGGPSLSHTLLEKRDGSFYLMLWLEDSDYDVIANTATLPVPQTVTVSLNGVAVAKQVVSFDGTGTATPTNVSGSPSALTLNVTEQLTVLRIAPQ